MAKSEAYTIPELITVVLARHIEDGWLAVVGTASYEAAIACRLAQMTHAPNLTWLFGGIGAVNPQLKPMPPSTADGRGMRGAESVIGIDEVDDYELAGRVDLFFAGGIQIDRYGNLNLVCVGDYGHPRFRGPGSVGLPFLSRVKRVFIFTRAQNRRTFVEKVDFVSGVGYLEGPGSRSRKGLKEDEGPSLVVTNLAVMDFDPASKRMRLKSLHPGVSLGTVIENTGFDLLRDSDVPSTPPPTEAELRLIRKEIDTEGILRRIV
jgi:glutaconate CoA-transferase subunit B